MDSKRWVLLVIVVLLGGIATYRLASFGRTALPDDPETTSHWMCEVCGAQESLTTREVSEWMDSDRLVRDEDFPNDAIVFFCPECGGATMCRARHCEIHDRFYVEWSPNSADRLNCPDCDAEEARWGYGAP